MLNKIDISKATASHAIAKMAKHLQARVNGGYLKSQFRKGNGQTTSSRTKVHNHCGRVDDFLY